MVGEEMRYLPAQFIDPEIGKFYPLRFCTDLCTFVVGSVSVSVPLFPTHLVSAASYVKMEFIATNLGRNGTGPRHQSTQGVINSRTIRTNIARNNYYSCKTSP